MPLYSVSDEQTRKGASIRQRINQQREFQLDAPPKLTREARKYYKKYRRIDQVLSRMPELLDLLARDLGNVGAAQGGGRRPEYSCDTILRLYLIKCFEDLTYRGLEIRLADSYYLREFARLYNQRAPDHTFLCGCFKQIRPQTWEKINALLKEDLIGRGGLKGKQCRFDTTAVETNIHYPTDSSLLWDAYRVTSRFLEQAKEDVPEIVGNGRLHRRKAKRLAQQLARIGGKPKKAKAAKCAYSKLILQTERVLAWAMDVMAGIGRWLAEGRGTLEMQLRLQGLLSQYAAYVEPAVAVIGQARRRVLGGENVPAEEKVFSIFEPHTEMIIRGKARSRVEFGHMIEIQQVEEKFITGYRVFGCQPDEGTLVESNLEEHRQDFGRYPEGVAADKGYYKSQQQISELGRKVRCVGIAKKGRRTEAEEEREHGVIFRALQKFRAGIEGTISYLKRCFHLIRCAYRGWNSFQSAIGLAVFAHNLIIAARLE